MTGGRPRGGKNHSGGNKAPRWSNGNIKWETVRTEHVNPILDSQIAPNTLRGLMYILKGKDILKKSDYHGLGDHITKWRKTGLIGWDKVIDGSGRGLIADFSDYQNNYDFVDTYVNYLKYGGSFYRQNLNTKWRWYGQPNYVEIWCEKHAIGGTVNALVGDNYVRVAFNRGNPGWKYMKDNCERLKNEIKLENRERIYVWYLGDYDKIGLHMDEEIKDQLEYFGLGDFVKFERIAVLSDQVSEYNLPRNFESGSGYEIDALYPANPQKFKNLILDHINPYFDKDIHKRVLEEHPEKTIDDMIREQVTFREDKQ